MRSAQGSAHAALCDASGGAVWFRVSARRTWFAACLSLAILIVVYALYFDYSDAYLYSVIAGAIALSGLVWPRIGIVVGATVLLAALIAGSFSAIEPSYFGVELRPGTPRSEVVKRLGPPQVVIKSAREMADLRIGYSKPSPWRYRQIGPIEVYTRGEHALWIYYGENGRLAYYFIGGS